MNIINKLIIFSILAVSLLLCLFLFRISPWRSTHDILERFYNSNVPENQIADELIIHSKPMCPVICQKIKDKNMPKRGYAILFLGNESFKDGKDVLLSILQDDTENSSIKVNPLILNELWIIGFTSSTKLCVRISLTQLSPCSSSSGIRLVFE
jgi:hypothetical protein